MASKREDYRHLKRLPVKFKVGEMCVSGYTEDISLLGFFIKASLVQGPGRELMVELTLPQDRVVRMIAKVQWAKKIPPALLRTCKGGMGFTISRFLSGEEDYRAYCNELQNLRMERDNFAVKPPLREE